MAGGDITSIIMPLINKKHYNTKQVHFLIKKKKPTTAPSQIISIQKH
ncbi:hypothetical protein ESCAB7627_0354 [Escherichia albertii TW07627]|uniref:Uncharacterized protein n=1 Tax=Escherichia albertii (strain TW07627) TaxID=502347 RepID=A0ABC9NPM1_ESCAT|nr:hypothetical protein ESCAB7627_0354 [Escherichia albertii TW07627]